MITSLQYSCKKTLKSWSHIYCRTKKNIIFHSFTHMQYAYCTHNHVPKYRWRFMQENQFLHSIYNFQNQMINFLHLFTNECSIFFIAANIRSVDANINSMKTLRKSTYFLLEYFEEIKVKFVDKNLCFFIILYRLFNRLMQKYCKSFFFRECIFNDFLFELKIDSRYFLNSTVKQIFSFKKYRLIACML